MVTEIVHWTLYMTRFQTAARLKNSPVQSMLATLCVSCICARLDQLTENDALCTEAVSNSVGAV